MISTLLYQHTNLVSDNCMFVSYFSQYKQLYGAKKVQKQITTIKQRSQDTSKDGKTIFHILKHRFSKFDLILIKTFFTEIKKTCHHKQTKEQMSIAKEMQFDKVLSSIFKERLRGQKYKYHQHFFF